MNLTSRGSEATKSGAPRRTGISDTSGREMALVYLQDKGGDENYHLSP